jgi:hypothetical protein
MPLAWPCELDLPRGSEGPPPPNAQLASGAVYLSKDRFEVHTKDVVDYVYVVGSGGLEVGDGLRIEDPLFHGMRWSKWGATVLDASLCSALTNDQEASNSLVTVSTDGSATLSLGRNVDVQDIHEYAYTEVIVEGGALVEGDEIRVRYGDTSTDPTCAHQFPDRAMSQVRWAAYEQIGASAWNEIEPAPTFEVQGKEATQVHVAAPSYLQVGEAFALKVAVLDRLGNAQPGWKGSLSVDGDSHAMAPQDEGWHDFELSLTEPGVHRIEVDAGALGVALSNPIVVTEEAPERQLYWGDIHVHHGHSTPDGAGGRVNHNHTYARDVIGLQVVSESMKLPPIEIEGEELWTFLQEDCVTASSPDYLVLLGFEWMGNLVGANQGHHNLYFDACEVELTSHDELGELAAEDGVYAWMEALESGTGVRSVAVPHATIYTGFNWTDQDARLRSAVEIYSEWGNSIDAEQPGSVQDALAKGFRMGFIAASDNHDGWMGNPFSEKNARSGLAAFWAPELSREAIWEALQGKHTYGTTGSRILLDIALSDARGSVREGEIAVTDQPTLTWTAHGTDTLSRVRVLAVDQVGGGYAQELALFEPDAMDAEGSHTLTGWNGDDLAVWVTVAQEDGEQAWSTPIYLTQDCTEGEVDIAGLCGSDTGSGDTEDARDTQDSGAGPQDSQDDPGPRSRCAEGCGGSEAAWLLAPGLLGLLWLRRRR